MDNEVLVILKSLQEDMQFMKSDIKDMKSNIKDLKSDVEGLKSDVKDLKSDVEGLKSDVKGLKSDVKDLKSEVELIKITQNEHTQILRALEHKTDVISAEQENLKHENAEIKGEIVELKKGLSDVELITASNWSDIIKLKAVK
jgi:chromosome segregation ATPase